MPVTDDERREYARVHLEERKRRCELHCVEEMETALRTLFGCHYLPDRVRDVITLAIQWGCSIGQDARVKVEEEPTIDQLLWEDQPTPVQRKPPK